MKSDKTKSHGVKPNCGFSLTELAALLAMLVLTGFVMAPALARTKTNGWAIGCLNNQRRVMEAWIMYTEEHSDRVVNNCTIPGTERGIADGTYQTWANDVLDWSTASDNTNAALLRVGQLAPYLNGNPEVFRCPADNFVGPTQVKFGWTARVRSISMNGLFGLDDPSDPTAPESSWFFGGGYFQYLKVTKVPKPAKTWVILDEHADSLNDGFFAVSTSVAWGDVPASYHNGGCGFGFADGHSEIKKWLSSTSNRPVEFFYWGSGGFDYAGRKDYQWYAEHTGYVQFSSGKLMYGY